MSFGGGLPRNRSRSPSSHASVAGVAGADGVAFVAGAAGACARRHGGRARTEGSGIGDSVFDYPAPMTVERLVTARLVLRMWRDDDAEGLAAINASPEVGRFLGGPMMRGDSDAMLGRMRAHWDARGHGVWALERRAPDGSPGSLVGLAGVMVPRWEAKIIDLGSPRRRTPCVEILWCLHPTAWGYGFVTEAARAALDDGFARHPFPEVLSFTVRQNERSWRVMERLGMTRSPDDDFDHPLVAEGDPLRPHIVYRVTRDAWTRARNL